MKKLPLLIITLLSFAITYAQHGCCIDADEWKRRNDSVGNAWLQRSALIQNDDYLSAHTKDSLLSPWAELDFFSLCHERAAPDGDALYRPLPELQLANYTFTSSVSMYIPTWGKRITWITVRNTADSIVESKAIGADTDRIELGAHLQRGVYVLEVSPANIFQQALVVKINTYSADTLNCIYYK